MRPIGWAGVGPLFPQAASSSGRPQAQCTTQRRGRRHERGRCRRGAWNVAGRGHHALVWSARGPAWWRGLWRSDAPSPGLREPAVRNRECSSRRCRNAVLWRRREAGCRESVEVALPGWCWASARSAGLEWRLQPFVAALPVGVAIGPRTGRCGRRPVAGNVGAGRARRAGIGFGWLRCRNALAGRRAGPQAW